MITNHYLSSSEFIVHLELTTKAPLHIGSGINEGGSDEAKTVIKTVIDGKETPYIPGTSLKGVFRSEIERMLRSSKELFACDPFSSDNCGDRLKKLVRKKTGKDITKLSHEELEPFLVLRQSESDQGLCAACALFGSKVSKATLFVSEAYPVSSPVPLLTKPGIAITRNNGSVLKSGLFFVEFIPPGIKFRFSIVLKNSSAFKRGLLASLIKSVNLGFVKLGAFTTKGFGEVQLVILKTIERDSRTQKVEVKEFEASSKATMNFLNQELREFVKLEEVDV